jgi:hypothetical protein
LTNKKQDIFDTTVFDARKMRWEKKQQMIKVRNALVGQIGERQFRRTMHRHDDNIKMGLKKLGYKSVK